MSSGGEELNPGEIRRDRDGVGSQLSSSSVTDVQKQEDEAGLVDKVEYQDTQIFHLNKRINELSSIVAMIPQLQHQQDQHRKALNSQFQSAQMQERKMLHSLMQQVKSILASQTDLKVVESNQGQGQDQDRDEDLLGIVQQLVDQNKQLKNQNVQLQNTQDSEKQNLKNQNQQLVDQNQKLIDQNMQLKNSEKQNLKIMENQQVLDQNVQLNNEKQDLKNQNLQLVDSNTQLKEQILQLENSYQNFKNENQEVVDLNLQLDNEKEDLKNQNLQLVDSNTQLKDQIVQLQNTFNNEKQQLRYEIQQLSFEKQDLNSKVSQFTNENQKLTEKIIQLDVRLQKESQNKNTKSENSNPEIGILLDEKLKLDQQNSQSYNGKNNQLHENKKLVPQNENLQISQLQSDNWDLIQKTYQLDEKMTNQKIQQQQISQDQNIQYQISNLKEDNQNLNQQIKQLNDQFKDDKQNLSNENLKLKSENQILNFQIAQLTDNKKQSNQKFSASSEQQQQQNEQLQQQQVSLDRQNFKNNQHVQNLHDQISQLTQENQNLNEKISELKDQYSNDNNNLTNHQNIHLITNENSQNRQLSNKIKERDSQSVRLNEKSTNEIQDLIFEDWQLESGDQYLRTDNKNISLQKFQQEKFKFITFKYFVEQINSAGIIENAILVLNINDIARNSEKFKKKIFSVTVPVNTETTIKNLYVIGPQLSNQLSTSQLTFHVNQHIQFFNCEFRNIEVVIQSQNNDMNIFLDNIQSQFEFQQAQQAAKFYQLYGFQIKNFGQVQGSNIFIENMQNGLRVNKCKNVELNQVNIIDTSMEGLGCYECEFVKLNSINVQNSFLYPSDIGFCYGIHIVNCKHTAMQNSTTIKCRWGITFQNCKAYLFQCRVGNCRQGVVLQNSKAYKDKLVQLEDNVENFSLCSRSKWMTEIDKFELGI